MASYRSQWQAHPHNVPPPFQGAPPLPTGINVPPNHWNQGTWMPNPLYNPQSSRPNVNVAQWMPGTGWGIQQRNNAYYPAYQHQQSYNPYKRQPKPPSAEYLALKLSDNPLGLTNMVPAEEVERQERERQLQEVEQQAQTTPWLWAPRQLDDEDDPDQDTDNDAHQPATPPAPATPEPFASKATLQPTFSSNIVRTPQHYRSSAPVQIYASPKRPLDRGASVDNLASEIGRLSTGPNASAPLVRHHSMPATLSTNNYPNAPSSITGETLTREPDPMELLSPLAGVLPPPKSASSRSNLGRHSSVPPVSNSSSLDPIPESSATKALSHSRSHTPAPPNHRHHSHHEPIQSSRSRSKSTSRHDGSRSSSASPYSNEQSPVSPTYAYSSSSGHSPYHPHPQSSSSSSPSYQDPHIRNPLPAPPKPYEPPPAHRTTEPFGINHHYHTSPGTSNSSYTYMPPTSAPPTLSPSNTRSKSSSATAVASYTQSTTALSNYTEEPGTAILHANGKSTVINLSSSSTPHEISSLSQPSTTTTTTTTTTSTSTSTPIDSPKKRKKSKHQLRRKGFWNRRGDHVTSDGYIVYAPPHSVYPPDLDGYPDGKDEGYMNEDGHITPWFKRPPYNPPGGYSSLIDYV